MLKLNLNNRLFILLLAFLFQACNNKGEQNSQASMSKSTVDSVQDATATSSIYLKNFPEFWCMFRLAVVDSNYAKLKSLIQFPLVIEGYEDIDPVLEIATDSFISLWFEYLKEHDVDYNNQDISRRAFFKALIDVQEFKDYSISDDHARVEYMEFVKTKNGWRLSLIYMKTKLIQGKFKVSKEGRDQYEFPEDSIKTTSN